MMIAATMTGAMMTAVTTTAASMIVVTERLGSTAEQFKYEMQDFQ
jgi:hypothetical protein